MVPLFSCEWALWNGHWALLLSLAMSFTLQRTGEPADEELKSCSLHCTAVVGAVHSRKERQWSMSVLGQATAVPQSISGKPSWFCILPGSCSLPAKHQAAVVVLAALPSQLLLHSYPGAMSHLHCFNCASWRQAAWAVQDWGNIGNAVVMGSETSSQKPTTKF